MFGLGLPELIIIVFILPFLLILVSRILRKAGFSGWSGETSMNDHEYAGFWIRTGATILDSLLILIITGPILTIIYGTEYWVSESFIQGFWDVLLSFILPAVAVIIFWVYKSATPGKMATKLIIVDAKTGGKPSTGQCIERYLAYFIAVIPLFLGVIWVAFDKRKQGWHDKLAGTAVIKNNQPEPDEVDTQIE